MAEQRPVRYSDKFLRLVHLLAERGVEHAKAARLAREALGELQHEPASDDWIKLHGESRPPRLSEPKRC